MTAHIDIRKNNKDEFAMYFTGWDTPSDGNGHPLSDCRDLIEKLSKSMNSLTKEIELTNQPPLFDESQMREIRDTHREREKST